MKITSRRDFFPAAFRSEEWRALSRMHQWPIPSKPDRAASLCAANSGAPAPQRLVGKLNSGYHAWLEARSEALQRNFAN